jgi:hypothetical protein
MEDLSPLDYLQNLETRDYLQNLSLKNGGLDVPTGRPAVVNFYLVVD